MAPDAHDRWLFLLTVAALPLACADDAPVDTTTGESTSTTDSPTTAVSTTGESEGSTSIVTTTGVDGTSTGGETTANETGSTSTGGSSSSGGTTMGVEGSTSTGEGSSSTGEPQGLCEVWGEALSLCYGYYDPAYFTNSCYYYLMSVDVTCAPVAAMYYQCQATGCFVDCSTEYDALQECNDLLLAMELGCDMIPVVPGLGTIPTQCTGVVDQAEVCTASGYYIPGFSGYIMYAPEYAEYFCQNGAYFTNLFPPPGVGDECGGAYEELLTCLSGLSCSDFENAMFDDTTCGPQKDALTCRCELGA